MKREREKKEKMILFTKKNVSRPSNPPDELAQNVSKKNPFRTNYSSIFSAKVQNLAVFSFIYMIRIRFFGPQELIQKYFRRARYEVSKKVIYLLRHSQQVHREEDGAIHFWRIRENLQNQFTQSIHLV